MRFKRILALAAAVLILAAVSAAPFSAGATFVMDGNSLKLMPGNLQSSSPVYNMAWLDNVIIRDDAMAVTQATIIPKADYPYSHTYSEFVADVARYKLLHSLDEGAVEQGLNEMINVLFYVVTACGMTVNEDAMAKYVSKQGIRMPVEMTSSDRAKTAIVFAAIKYDAMNILYKKNVTVPRGITLDEAIVIILASLMDLRIPSGIDTVLGLGMYNIKSYVEGFDQIPVSDNPDSSELFHWIKIVTAAQHKYPVPMAEYNSATQAQVDYVDCAYYASILETAYNVHISPAALLLAEESPKSDEVARLILKTMLIEKETEYDEDASCEELFDLACLNGYFDLKNEFFTDILNYDLYVDKSCEKLWMTPFALADQIGGNNANVRIFLGEKEMKPSETAFAPLDPKKENEKVTLLVDYNDGNGKEETATYCFNIFKTEKNAEGSTASNDILANIQNQISSVVPSDNEKVNEILGGVMDAVDSKLTPPETKEDTRLPLITAPAETEETETEEFYDETDDEKSSGGYEFGYLEDLMQETYTTAAYTEPEAEYDAEDSFAARATEAVKENPEIVAAPTGVLAVSVLAGYMLSTKRKHSSVLDEEESE